MTPERMKDIRIMNGLSLSDMARVLRLSEANGADKIREFERGARQPSGPITLIYEILEFGDVPNFVFEGVDRG